MSRRRFKIIEFDGDVKELIEYINGMENVKTIIQVFETLGLKPLGEEEVECPGMGTSKIPTYQLVPKTVAIIELEKPEEEAEEK